MPLQNVRITEVSNGETVQTNLVNETSSFHVVLNGEELSPEVVTEIEFENDGDNSQVSDQCGRTERQRTTNKGIVIRVRGLVTGNVQRNGNLSVQELLDVVAQRDTVEIVTDLKKGNFAVANTVVTQSSDLVSLQTQDTDGEEQAFEFQLQLGESESD